MTLKESKRYEMLVRVRKFGESHREAFPATSVGGQAFQSVGTAVAELAEHAVSKQSSEHGGKRARSVSRNALLRAVEEVRRCARVIANDTPGFADPFHLARTRTDTGLVTTGQVFVREAAARKERFEAFGMPEDFVTRLSSLVTELEQAIGKRQDGRDGQTAARANIGAALESGLAAVRKLDIIVPNRLRTDSAALAVWEQDRKVELPRRVKRAKPEADEATRPTADATAPEAAQPAAPGSALTVAS